MLELLQKIIAVLTADTTLTALIPVGNILTGPVDITMEKQSELLYPQINIHIVAESQRSVPISTRDTQVQIDIWSRNSQLEMENIYEQIISDLSYKISDEGSAHIFWMRLNGAVDFYEGDRRIWHRAMTFTAWTLK